MATRPAARIERTTLDFLRTLNKHNDRDWFTANKDLYLAAHANMVAFTEALIARLGKHDRISTASGKESLMRIYADQRFHKDRPPYKPRFAGGFGRVKPELRGGYFYHIEPGKSHVTCGFMGPEPADLKRIRTDILHDHGAWQRLLGAPAMRKNFGGLIGDQLRTAPRGFPHEHPASDLLRRRQFLLRHPLTDKDVLADDLLERIDGIYRSVRPFFDHMSEVLTTDENGNPLRGRPGR